MYIDGQWVDSNSGETFLTADPATGNVLAAVPKGNKEDVDLAVKAARDAFEGSEWSDMLPMQRGRLLNKMAGMIRGQKDKLAELETLDTGKPLAQAYADVEVGARYYEYYAGIADKILGESIPVNPNIVDFTFRS
jgi:aldehyde dehydrogenase (NAD+)